MSRHMFCNVVSGDTSVCSIFCYAEMTINRFALTSFLNMVIHNKVYEVNLFIKKQHVLYSNA